MRLAPSGPHGAEPAFAPIIVAFGAAGLVAFAELYGVQAVLPAIAAEFDVAPSSAALVQSAGALGLAIGVVPWAFAARRVARGTLLRVALVATILLGPVVALAGGLSALLVLRFVQGAILAGIPALAVTHLADVLRGGRAASAAGWYVAGTALGGLSGRLLAGWVGTGQDWRMSLLAVSGLSALGVAVFLLLTPRVVEVPTAPGEVGRTVRSTSVLTLCAIALLQMGAFVAVYNFIGFRLREPPFALPSIVVTLVFVIYLVGSVAAARSGRFVDRWGRKRVVVVAISLQTIGALLTVPEWLPAIVLGMGVMTAAFFALHAVAAGWVAQLGRGSAFPSALYTIAYYVGAGAVSWALGLLYDGGGWTEMTIGVGALGVAATVVGVLGLPRSARPGA